MILFTGGGVCAGGLCPPLYGNMQGLCPGGSLSKGGSLSMVGGGSAGGVSVRETLPPYGNVRAVRILLECILVYVSV